MLSGGCATTIPDWSILLDADEQAIVVAYETAHARHRHDTLYVNPFSVGLSDGSALAEL